MAASSSSLPGYYANPPLGSDQFRCLMLREEVSKLYRPSPDPLHFYNQVDVKKEIYPSDPKRGSQAAQRIMKDFKKEKTDYAIGENAAFGLMHFASVGMQAGVALAPGFPPGYAALLVPIISEGMNILIGEMSESGVKANKEKIALEMTRLHRDHGNLSALDLPSGDDLGQRRYKILFDSDHPALSPELANASPEVRDLHQETLINMLSHFQISQENEMVELGNQLHSQGIEIRHLDEKIVQVNRAFLDFRDQTTEHLTNIDQSISHINGALQTINDRVAVNEEQIKQNAHDNATNRLLIVKNQKDIHYMQGCLFGKMDPQEQLDALHHGFFPNMPPAEKQDLEEKIKVVQKRQELMENMSRFANGAQDLLKIADNLNIPVSPQAKRAVELGTQALNVGLSFATGNYLGAVVGLTGMLGMGKKSVDVGGERHKQVMNALSELAQGQSAILQNQDQLLKWSAYLDSRIGQVLEGQKALYEKMNQIEKKIDAIIRSQEILFQNLQSIAKALEEHHRIMMEQFAGIINRLVIIRLEIRSIALEGVSNCRTAVKFMYRHPGYIRTENRFQSYSQLLDYYYNFSKNFLPEGLKALLPKLANVGTETDANFLLPADLDYSNHLGEQEDSIRYFSDLTHLCLELVSRREERKICLSSLINPITNSSELKQKLEALYQIEPEKCLPKRLAEIFDPTRNPDVVEMQKLIGRLYSPNVAWSFAEYALRFHYFLDLFSGQIGTDLYTLDQLRERIAQQGGTTLTGKILLEDAIVRLDVAIAQQSLLSGDYSLEKLSPLFDGGRTDDNHELYDKMIGIFNGNYMLVRNFVIHSFCSKIGERFPAYSLAYHNESMADNLSSLLGAHWHFVRKENKWHVEIGVYAGVNALPIPTPQEFLAGGEFLISEEVRKLHGMRTTLIEELLRYDFARTRALPIDREIYMRALAARV